MNLFIFNEIYIFFRDSTEETAVAIDQKNDIMESKNESMNEESEKSDTTLFER